MTARTAAAPRMRNMDRAHVALFALRRRELERWIDRAIAVLDDIDGEPDIEDDEREPDIDEWNGDEGREDGGGTHEAYQDLHGACDAQGLQAAVRYRGRHHPAV